jgi:acyl-CoA thioesterase-1
MKDPNEQPDPLQGHTREWPSTPYSDEARCVEPAPEQACCIVLVGDCTMSCGQWPPAHRPENQLAVRLRRAFPNQPFVIRNISDDGGSAGSLLASKRLGGLYEALPRLDIAFLRFGVNDRKRDGVSGCIANLRTLCQRLVAHDPGVLVVIETGMWVDYPRHYLWDRNSKLAPLYDAMRKMADAEGYPVVDVFARTRAETERGNWDLRVRGFPDPAHTILDESFDAFYGDDPAFYTNIHPNARCLGLIADWEVAKLKERFGCRLPNV